MTAAPDVTEYVIGYRAWRVRRNGKLVSVAAGRMVWAPGVNDASCVCAWHAAPAGECSCGLYAFHDPPPAPSPGIVGAIKARGQLESHHDGFRAQHAEIVALVRRGRQPRRRELRAAGIYQVPLVDVQSLPVAAAEHGRPLAADQRPARWRGELREEFLVLERAHEAFGAGYARIVAPLRRHPRVRAFLLNGLSYGPLFVLLAFGYVAALTMREVSVSGWREVSVSSGWMWLAAATALLRFLLLAVRDRFGSGWLMPMRTWPTPAALAFGIGLQLSGNVGMSGLTIEALKWAIGLMAVGVIGAGLFSRCVFALRQAMADERPARLVAGLAWGIGLLLLPQMLLSLHDHALLLVVCSTALVFYGSPFPLRFRALRSARFRQMIGCGTVRGLADPRGTRIKMIERRARVAERFWGVVLWCCDIVDSIAARRADRRDGSR